MKFKTLRLLLTLLASAAGVLISRPARATERRYGFTEESTVLRSGAAELAPWTTVRAGRAAYYSRLEGRLELEYGLAKNFQGSLFWNFSSTARDSVLPGSQESVRLAGTEFEAVSGNLKYKLSDPVTDSLGSAFALEGSYGPQLGAALVRLILDKQFGSLLLAGNGTGQLVWALDGSNSALEKDVTLALGAAYFVTPKFVAGFETRSENGFGSKLERSVLYFGPSVSWLASGCWATLAVEPQLSALKGGTPHQGHLDLDRNERVQARAVLGFPLQ